MVAINLYNPIVTPGVKRGPFFAIALLIYFAGILCALIIGSFSGLILRKKALQNLGAPEPLFSSSITKFAIGCAVISLPVMWVSWSGYVNYSIKKNREKTVYWVNSDIKKGDVLTYNYSVLSGNKVEEAPADAIRGSVYLRPGQYKATQDLKADTFLTWEMIEDIAKEKRSSNKSIE